MVPFGTQQPRYPRSTFSGQLTHSTATDYYYEQYEYIPVPQIINVGPIYTNASDRVAIDIEALVKATKRLFFNIVLVAVDDVKWMLAYHARPLLDALSFRPRSFAMARTVAR
jgi:hypothetical protein